MPMVTPSNVAMIRAKAERITATVAASVPDRTGAAEPDGSRGQAEPMTKLPPAREIELLRLMALSREGDRREGICFRQGLGGLQVPGAGHEALAVIAGALRDGDIVLPHYRDRALMLALGISNYELALEFFGKGGAKGGGRQLPNHFSDQERNIFSYASPTGLQCLPAAGMAWAMRFRGSENIAVCFVGDATVRQGEYYEAVAFALQLKLPVVFVVEDNGIGISTPTAPLNPYTVSALANEHRVKVDGRDPAALLEAFENAAGRARSGEGPTVIWAELDRMWSHTSTDDHRNYRPSAEIEAMAARDPLATLSRKLAEAGHVDAERWQAELQEIAATVDGDYRRAHETPEPSADSVMAHIFSTEPLKEYRSGQAVGSTTTMLKAVNDTLSELLAGDDRVVMFGEDIADPKGGVFGITKGLSTLYPGRVVNSPLAEATIAGVGAGLAANGFRPIVELQFIDFVGPAFHQIANQIATLRWRTMGQWSCPLVIMAPCGGYLPSGGPWHSQSNEGWFAHIPGLQVVVPSRAADAAALLRAAAHGNDPVLYLLPKHLLRAPDLIDSDEPVRIGQARIAREGSDVTVVAWGNTVSLALEAADALATSGVAAEIVDLRSIVPCDWPTVIASLEKTGRLIVVQEDNRTCSFGQAIIAELTADRRSWNLFAGPPQLVTRDDVHIAFNASSERATLPTAQHIADAVWRAMEF